MGSNARSLELGVIICKHCGTIIDTVNTNRVQTFYSDCMEESCVLARLEQGEEDPFIF
ncbi:GapA-binding peptide SR1P [Paenibacillus sp. N1-5-1-14]|uniref:GapA-binding peptide SR1P n=1 Tax=Paenibacillus radicibacter TaxID=2972488 RepID=UPI0021597120|nr:GapA-binding peptide SR1P [Paenibacillus radicibacter]MCR8642509.1 GapA-binding peptide SR1P [Paenibacillus radicibacter]